jgi:hypothetical protein
MSAAVALVDPRCGVLSEGWLSLLEELGLFDSIFRPAGSGFG